MFEFVTQPPVRNDADSSTLCMTTDNAVQELIRERDQLREELALRHCALNAAVAHFMIIDAQARPTRILFVNRALADSHGYEIEELMGAEPAVLVVRDDCEDQYAELLQGMREGKNTRVQLRSRRRDGSTFWSGIAMSPVRDSNGKVTHFVAVGSDITRKLEDERNRRDLQYRLYAEMKERERMSVELRIAQKLEAVGQLAAGIAHEINTPVQYVGDSVLFLQTALLDLERLIDAYRVNFESLPGGVALTAARERIAEAERAADLPFLHAEVPRAFERTLEGIDRVANIVRAMKEFAHPDSNQQAAADVNRALQTTLTIASNEYKYISQVKTSYGEIPHVMCNVGELNQVFLNLIVNAAHAVQESGKDAATGVIAISTCAGDGVLRVRIEDNGCGIPDANRERIFDPFFTTKEVGKGTGQGLAIARSIIVEKHGGRIDVQSTPGQGTTFTIEIPVDGKAEGIAA
jgi:PAS domain S-box-containing protein